MKTLLLVIASLSQLSCQNIKVTKSWNAVVTLGETTKLACKASSNIAKCFWINKETDDEFDSEETRRGDNEIVEVDDRNGICYLEIDVAKNEHDGEWKCVLEGDCEEDRNESFEEFPTRKRSQNLDECSDDRRPNKRKRRDNTAEAGRKGRQKRRSGRDRDRNRYRERCENSDRKTLTLNVVEEDEVKVAPAQEKYYANLGSAVSITIRTNGEFKTCKVELEIDRRNQFEVEIDGDARRDECKDLPNRLEGRVCLSVTSSTIPSCLLKIETMTEDMEGDWDFTIERDIRRGRPGTISDTASVPLVKIEVPEEVVLKYEGEEYREGRRKKTLKLEEGKITVECISVGGSTEDITMELYIGDRDLSEDNRECRGGSNEVCQEFQFDATGSMDGKEMICVARLPSVDDSDSSRRQNLEYNGKQVAVEVEIETAPKLVRTNCDDDLTTLTVCDERLREGRDYELVVQFDSKPEPTTVEWTLRSDNRRERVTVKAGNKVETYDTTDFRSARDRDYPNRYEAAITFERISDEDLDSEHELLVRNEVDETVFLVVFGAGSDCSDGGGDTGEVDDCCETCRNDRECRRCEENCDLDCCDKDCRGRECRNCRQCYLPSTQEGGLEKIRPFLDSCLAMGTSLLASYEPSGEKRASSSSSREEERFRDLVEEFFTNAKCSGYARDISDSYRDQRRQNQPLRTSGNSNTFFNKLDPTKGAAGVVKTKLDIVTSEEKLVQTLGLAAKVIENNNSQNITINNSGDNISNNPGEPE